MDPETYDPRYLRGVEHFNRHAFFDSHDAWEEAWLEQTGRTKDFFKGLIQGAVALYHFQNRNFGGARKLWTGCRRLLEPFRPKYLGLDVERFLEEMSRCFAELCAAPAAGPLPRLARERVPRIQLDPAP